MGFGKVAIIFILLALFAVTFVAMASTADHDKPTDSYYTNSNNTAMGSTQLSTTAFGVTGNLMLPVLGIAGILVLFAGMMILRRK